MTTFVDKKSFYLLGIKGVAMANIALILKDMNKRVFGFDTQDEFITEDSLRRAGILYESKGSFLKKLSAFDVFVYSAVHGGSENTVIKEARSRGKLIVSQAELIGEMLTRFPYSIAVSGCHGKTTTSSLIAFMLEKLNLNPSYLIGAPSFKGIGGSRYKTNSKYFIFEADEYGVEPPRNTTPKLLYYHPTHIVCTNIDYDHPDVYQNIEQVRDTFQRFFNASKLYLCADDPHLKMLYSNYSKKNYLTYGYSQSADLLINSVTITPKGSKFKLTYQKTELGFFFVHLFGEKNILNVAGAVLVLLDLGVSASKIKIVLKAFSTVKRRLEIVYRNKNFILVDDYAHHPAEIHASISALKDQFPDRRIIIIFQPHTYSRTHSLRVDMVSALSCSDIAYVAPIFSSAREKKVEGINYTQELKEAVRKGKNANIRVFESKQQMLSSLTHQVKNTDIIVTMGAGDIYKLRNDIISILDLYV